MNSRTIFVTATALTLLLVSSVAGQGNTFWNAPPAVPSNWSLNGNWSAGSPTWLDDAYINNGGWAYINASEDCNSLHLGDQILDDGTLEIQSGGFLVCGSDLYVGNFGTGLLDLQSGSILDVNSDLYIADGPGSIGDVLMDGILLQVQWGTIQIGQGGNGSLDFVGGQITADTLDVGPSGSLTTYGAGTLVVNDLTGVGPTLDLWQFNLGHSFGSGNGSYTQDPNDQLTVGDRFLVGAGGSASFEQYGDVTAPMIQVNHDISAFYQIFSSTTTQCDFMTIGKDEGGLFYQHGGDMTITTDLTVGDDPGSVGEYVLFGGTLDVTTALVNVGDQGHGVLRIDGGELQMPDGTLSLGMAGGDGELRLSGGLALVDTVDIGPTSSITSSGIGTLRVNSITGLPAATTIDGSLELGHGGGGGSGVLTVGASEALTFGESVRVGYGADADLIVEDGGDLTSAGGHIGYGPGTTGTVTVDGNGSTWIADTGPLLPFDDYSLIVGEDGTGRLDILDGGYVRASICGVGGGVLVEGGDGTITIDGNNSRLETAQLSIGGMGTGQVNVTEGGRILGYGDLTITGDGSMTISDTTGTSRLESNDVLVDNTVDPNGVVGSGAFDWDIGDDLTIGWSGTTRAKFSEATITVLDAVMIGANAGSDGDLTLDGGASLSAYQVVVGDDEDPNFNPGGTGSMTVSVAQVDVVGFTVGSGPGSDGLATIEGGTSILNAPAIVVAGAGAVGELRVQDDADVQNPLFVLLGTGLNSDATVIVEDPGTTWTAVDIVLAGDGAQASLTVQDGAVMTASGALQVGTSGIADGTLNVLAGGTLSNASAELGVQHPANATVTVSGGGSTWSNSGSVHVGGGGGARAVQRR